MLGAFFNCRAYQSVAKKLTRAKTLPETRENCVAAK